MRRALASAGVLALVGLAVALLSLPAGVDRRDLVADAYLVFLVALLALTAFRIGARAFPAPAGVVPRVITRPRRRAARPEALEQLQNVVELAESSELDTHFRLRSILREIAEAGLATRAGADLDAMDGRAEAALTPAAWSLLRQDRPRPLRADRRGIDIASLATLVDELESMVAP